MPIQTCPHCQRAIQNVFQMPGNSNIHAMRTCSPTMDFQSCFERSADGLCISSPDGRLKLGLERVGAGILLNRRHVEQLQEVEHAIVFADRGLFCRYVDSDPLRFHYVPQYVELRTAFDELLAQPA